MNGVFENCLKTGSSWVFVDFGVKSRVRKLPNCLLLVEVGALNYCPVALVSCSDYDVISVFEIYEDTPFFFGKVGEFGVAILS